MFRCSSSFYYTDVFSTADIGEMPVAVTESNMMPLTSKGVSFTDQNLSAENGIISRIGMITDFTITLPLGYFVIGYIINNTSANSCQLTCTETVSNVTIFSSLYVSASNYQSGESFKVFAAVGDGTITVNGSGGSDTWNGATVDFYFILKKIL